MVVEILQFLKCIFDDAICLQDRESASKFLSASEKENFYWELASAAESGWDFSTRWLR